MPFLFGKKKPVSENETFVALMQLARRDPDFREQISAILSMDDFHRKSALNSITDNMRMQNAPKDLVRAMESLADDAVAERALELIKNAK
ncbi:hypothetical protein Dalk_0742 [Desulfatibacillum aliphaticivorans]|uniref:Uncharacterized protein n=1 Tax=Desulfatibacillum aliphaticivorans TaxID=218208 RepID=B8FHN0_DESAL|nr:hypothetical protein [Desulfatibacillum aliphaticivorans]ACL02447.1 hypothetical protein Dalk_0742 [Desulfatibacillum aliphaticivorans]